MLSKSIAEETDYSILFYACDIFLVIAAAMTVWLKVDMEKSGQTTKESLKRLWTKPAVILFLFVFTLGYGWGVRDTYLFAYLQDELGASSSLISKNCWVSSINREWIFTSRFTVTR